jgi:TP901 family phage tail tape measure protein
MAITAEELRVLVSAQDDASSTLAGIGNIMDDLGSNALGMGKNFQAGLSTAQMAIVGFAGASAIGIAFATYQAAQFEKEMQIVSATSDVTGAELKKVGEEAMTLGQKYGVSATEMAKGLQVLGRAGVESSVQMKVLESALEMSKLEDMPVEEASENLVNIVKMYGDSLDNVERYSNALVHGSKISTVSISDLMEAMKFAGGDAKTLGWSMENLVATFSTLGEQGLDAQMVGTTMRGVLGMLIKETPKADEQLGKIGLTFDSFKDANGKIKQPLETIQTLYDAMFKKFGSVKEHGQEWAEFLNKVFPGAVGGKAVRLFTGMEEGDGGLLKKYTDQMNEGYDATKDVETAMDSAAVQAQKLWVAFTNLLIRVGDGFLPTLKMLVGGTEGVLSFFNENQWAVDLLANSLVLLAGAGMIVVGMWAKQYIVSGLTGAYELLKSGIVAITGEKALETRALDANTLAWARNINAQRGQTVLPGMTGIGPAKNQRSGGLMGSLGSALGLGTVGTAGVLLLVVGAIMLLIWYMGEKDKKYKQIQETITKYNGELDTQRNKEKELQQLIKNSPDGSEQQLKYRAQLKLTQDEIDRTIKKIHEQNMAIYKERSTDPRYIPGITRDYKGSGIVRGIGWESMSTYLAGIFAGKGEEGSIAAGSENALTASVSKWNTRQNEQMIASAYHTVLSANADLVKKQYEANRGNGTLTDDDIAKLKEVDIELGKIVGPENVNATKNLYIAEQNLQKARNTLANAEWRALSALVRLAGAIFGVRMSASSTSDSATTAAGDTQTLAAQIEDTASKAQTTADNIEKLVRKMDEWISYIEATGQALSDAWNMINNPLNNKGVGEVNKVPNDPNDPSKGYHYEYTGGSSGKTLEQKTPSVFDIPTTTSSGTLPSGGSGGMDTQTANKLGIHIGSPLTLENYSTKGLGGGVSKIKIPDLDPEKFQKNAVETGEKLAGKGSGGLYIEKLEVNARTKEDAAYIAMELRKALKEVADGVNK